MNDRETHRAAQRRHRWQPLALAGLCALFLLHITHTRFCSDDGAILWRYAKHLSEGHGLRYNIGDPPVEGCSNLSFAALMSLAYRSGIDPETATFGLGLALGLAALLLAHALARAAGLAPLLALVCTAALALNHSFAAWCTGGLGTKFYTAFVLLALLRFLREERHPELSWIPSALLLGLVAAIRPEGGLFFALVLLWRLLHPAGRRRALRVFVGSFLAIKGLQLGFQLLYFGNLLPNTFHAKITGLQVDRGLWYLGLFAAVYSTWLLLAFALPLLSRRTPSRLHPCRALLLVALGFSAAIAALGGGRFEFRLLDPILPLLTIAACGGVAALAARGAHGRTLAIAGAVAILLTSPCGSLLRRQAWFDSADFVTTESVDTVYREQKRKGLLLRAHLPPAARIACGAAGALPLYSELYTLDIHGLNDRVIAQLPAEHGHPLWHQRRARPQDHERAAVDYTELHLVDPPGAAALASRHGIPLEAVHAALYQLDRGAIPPGLARLLRSAGAEHGLCVRLAPSTYFIATTRLPAGPYRRAFRDRGYTVLW